MVGVVIALGAPSHGAAPTPAACLPPPPLTRPVCLTGTLPFACPPSTSTAPTDRVCLVLVFPLMMGHWETGNLRPRKEPTPNQTLIGNMGRRVTQAELQKRVYTIGGITAPWASHMGQLVLGCGCGWCWRCTTYTLAPSVV